MANADVVLNAAGGDNSASRGTLTRSSATMRSMFGRLSRVMGGGGGDAEGDMTLSRSADRDRESIQPCRVRRRAERAAQ